MNKRLAALGLSLGLTGGALMAAGQMAAAADDGFQNAPCATCDNPGSPTGVPGTDLQFQCKDATGRFKVSFFNPQGIPGLKYRVEGVTNWEPLQKTGAVVYVTAGSVSSIKAQIKNAQGKVIYQINKPGDCTCTQQTTTTTTGSTSTVVTTAASTSTTSTVVSSTTTQPVGSSTTDGQTTTTAAPRLPETGSTTGPIVIAGAGLVGVGLLAGAFSRKSRYSD